MTETYDVWFLVRYFFQFAWEMPFRIPFFSFGFTYGHLIYGGILICASVTVLGRFIHNKGGWKDGDTK